MRWLLWLGLGTGLALGVVLVRVLTSGNAVRYDEAESPEALLDKLRRNGSV